MAYIHEQSSWQLYDLEEKEGAKTFMGTLVEEEKLLAFTKIWTWRLLNSGHSIQRSDRMEMTGPLLGTPWLVINVSIILNIVWRLSSR